MVRWDLRGRAPFRQEILPHPSINLVADMHSVRVWGVPTRRDVRLLRDQGCVIGTKFRPGAFTAITGIEASSITDGSIVAPVVLAGPPETTLLVSADYPLAAARTEVEARLAPHAHIDDPALELVGAVMASMPDLPPHACRAACRASPRRAPDAAAAVSALRRCQPQMDAQAAPDPPSRRATFGRPTTALDRARSRARLLRPRALHPRLSPRHRSLAGRVRPGGPCRLKRAPATRNRRGAGPSRAVPQ